MTESRITELQQSFLDVLFDKAQGDFEEAKKLAGYSDSTKTSDIVSPIFKEKLAERIVDELTTKGAAKAIYKMMSILDDPAQVGKKETIAAAKDILDRAGFKAIEKVEVKAENPLFILPAKDENK